IFFVALMQDGLVKAQIGDQTFELAIFLPQLPQLTELADAQCPKAFLPAVERLLTHAELAADLADRCARLGLAQGEGDLLIGELARLHSHDPPAPAARVSRRRTLAQNAPHGWLRS